jgi:DNA repair exonuclease SbcCD ATPase subunit
MNIENQVEMLREIASDLKRMLAVHDEKLNQHERKQDDIFELIEQRRNDMAEDIKEIHSRITTVQRELCNEITATENRIIKGIDELKEELKTDQEFHNSKQKTLEQRIADLEKWRWIIIGAGITGGWVFSKLSSMVEIIVK